MSDKLKNHTKSLLLSHSTALAVFFSLSLIVTNAFTPALSADSWDDKKAKRNEIPNKLFEGMTVPEKPRQISQTVAGGRDKLISPPGEEPYFPIRNDGQAYIGNIDRTVNLTRALNEFYWDPHWRGEVWSPFDAPELVERAQHLMSLWPEYNEANVFRLFSAVNQTLERYSGYGPQ